MYAIEFETQPQGKLIEIPQKQWEELAPHIKDGVVRVILLMPEKPNTYTATQQTRSLLDDLVANPIRLSNVQYLSREEIYVRE